MVGHTPRPIDGLQWPEQLEGPGQWQGRGRIQPAQLLPLARPPGRQLKSQRQGIGVQNLRWIEGGAAILLGGAPKPHAEARTQPPGPAPPLLNAGQAGGDRHQAIHPRGGVEASQTAEAAINHQAHAGQGEGALGDGAGQHHLPLLMAGGANGLGLGPQGELGMEGHALQALSPWSGRDGASRGLDLTLTREKHQSRLPGRPIRQPPALQRPRHLPLQGLPRARGLVLHLHRVGAPHGGEHAGPIEGRRQGLKIQGG
jgi:hypothetical protein